MKKVAIISITKRGDEIMDTIAANEAYEYTLYSSALSKQIKLGNIVKDIFTKVDALVFITSLGICVRVIAPYIQSKTTDPAVVCIPNSAQASISVLSGHLGGANELTRFLANQLDCMPIITTATDSLGIKSPDMIAQENGLIIESMQDCKKMASILVEGGIVAVLGETTEAIGKGYVKHEEGKDYDGIINITNKTDKKSEPSLNLIRKNIVLGVGCKKDYSPDDMRVKVINFLNEKNIHEKAIAKICSVDIKKNEKAIIDLSRYLDAEYITYSVEQIKEIEHLFKGSAFVKSAIGIGAVAEPCVHLAGAEIVEPKINLEGMTLAIGEMRNFE